MDQEQQDQLSRQIIKEIRKIKADIDAFKELTKPVAPDAAIGRLTRMEAINSKSINEAALNKAKGRLTKLENALKTIDDPDYGLCSQCEEPIPFARMLIMPDSDMCVKCAEAANR